MSVTVKHYLTTAKPEISVKFHGFEVKEVKRMKSMITGNHILTLMDMVVYYFSWFLHSLPCHLLAQHMVLIIHYYYYLL